MKNFSVAQKQTFPTILASEIGADVKRTFGFEFITRRVYRRVLMRHPWRRETSSGCKNFLARVAAKFFLFHTLADQASPLEKWMFHRIICTIAFILAIR